MAEEANGSDVNWSQFFEELDQGQTLMKKLQARLCEEQTTLSDDLRTMGTGVLTSFEKLRSVAKTFDAQPPFLHSPCDHTPKKSQRSSPKKRKTLATRTEQVHVPMTKPDSLEVDDGYNWRKYGQKRIHGNRFPRGYYRCSHRFKGGCEALKTLQRSEEDPSIVEVTYRGEHTCRFSKGNSLVLKDLKAELRIKTESLDDGSAFAPTPQIANDDPFQLTPTSSSTGVSHALAVTPDPNGSAESDGENHWFPREYEEILSAASSVIASPTESLFCM